MVDDVDDVGEDGGLGGGAVGGEAASEGIVVFDDVDEGDFGTTHANKLTCLETGKSTKKLVPSR